MLARRAQRWVKRTHPNKSDHWRVGKYWGRLNFDRPLDRWVFGSKPTRAYLLKYRWFPIQRHTLVKGYASPDDPNLRDYWRQRAQAKAKTKLIPSRQKIAQKQGYVCPVCGETLLNEEVLQLHHKQPKAEGGNDSYGNLQLLHLYCHHQVHSGTVHGS
ncbi:MAG: HNH endonuclease signature motif containing protein [Cyanobacteria bacterium P01_D01_bin.44]